MKIKLWLNKITQLTRVTRLNIMHVSNVTNSTFVFTDDSEIDITYDRSTYKVSIIDDLGTNDFTGAQIVGLSDTNTFIELEGDITSIENVKDLFNLGILEFSENTKSQIFTYKLNCDKEVLAKEKSITFTGIIEGAFNTAIDLKNPTIDIDSYSFDFNYVYIKQTKRFYYVNGISLLSNKLTRLALSEDVLCTWEYLIRNQNAFISRAETSSIANPFLFDERLPVKDELTTRIYEPNDSTYQNKKNFDFYFDLGVYFVSCYSDIFTQLTNYNVDTIDYGYLPAIKGRKSRQCHYYLLDQTSYEVLLRACMYDSATATYIKSVVYIPMTFNSTLFHIDSNKRMYVGNEGKHLSMNAGNNKAGFTTTEDLSDILVEEIALGTCPYLVYKDFTFNLRNGNSASFLDIAPNTNYEIYLPFYGWYKLDNAVKLNNHRLIIYYSIDFETGISTVFIYDLTQHNVIFSSTCSVGVKMDLVTTNNLENTRQKQATDTNMILSLLGSTTGAVLGASVGSVKTVAGSVISAGKTIASAVNSHNMIFDKAQMTFGTSGNSLYIPNKVYIRETYHAAISINNNVYAHMQGKPCNRYVEVIDGNISGYAEIPEIHFNPANENIFQNEIDEIISLLKMGVIF